MKKKKQYLKEELFLIKRLAKDSTTRFSESKIYSYNSGVADLKDLLEAGYIRLEPMVESGEKKKYYKIGIRGWELIKKLEEEKRRKRVEKVQIGLTVGVMIIGLVTLVLQIINL